MERADRHQHFGRALGEGGGGGGGISHTALHILAISPGYTGAGSRGHGSHAPLLVAVDLHRTLDTSTTGTARSLARRTRTEIPVAGHGRCDVRPDYTYFCLISLLRLSFLTLPHTFHYNSPHTLQLVQASARLLRCRVDGWAALGLYAGQGGRAGA